MGADRIDIEEEPRDLDFYAKQLAKWQNEGGIGRIKQAIDVSKEDFCYLNLPYDIGLDRFNVLLQYLAIKRPGLEYLTITTSMSALPDAIGMFSNVKRLVLRQATLTQLPESITRLQFLEELDISNSKVSQIPWNIGSMKALSSVCMGGTPLAFRQLPISAFVIANVEINPLKECGVNYLEDMRRFWS